LHSCIIKDINNSTSLWKSLYRFDGSSAALTIVMLTLIQLIVFTVWAPLPSTTIDYFILFQNNWLLGLLHLDLLLLVDYVLLIPVFLGLYVALRRADESYMVIATALALAGTAIYFASHTAFSILSSTTNTRLQQ
jgi:hypothetical protein